MRPISAFVRPSTYLSVISRWRSVASAAAALRTRCVSSIRSSADSGPGASEGTASASSSGAACGLRPRSRYQFASRLWAIVISQAPKPEPRPRYWPRFAKACRKVREVSSSASVGREVRESR